MYSFIKSGNFFSSLMNSFLSAIYMPVESS